MSQDALRTTLVVVIEDPQLRLCLVEQIAELRASRAISDCDLEVSENDVANGAFEILRARFACEPPRNVVLVSDLLIETAGYDVQESWEPSYTAKDLLDEFSGRPLTTIAILDGPQRVAEIDQVIPKSCATETVRKALCRAEERLMYISRPLRKRLAAPVVVRPIRREVELLDYFGLRHRAYTVMGYLDRQVEDDQSETEIDWCDTTSLHFGAFEKRGPNERLIGCARVVITPPSAFAPNKDLIVNLASNDPVLRTRLERALPLGLPVFHSMGQRLFDVLASTALAEKTCGELSRVIVNPEYRGSGLSAVLVRCAVFHALKSGVDRLFLECLEIHEQLYTKLHFRRVPGAQGRVLSVGRTMIAMELDLLEVDVLIGAASLLKEQRQLCACMHRHCYDGGYELFGQPECPLRHLT
jgi:predicted GNAT family N-acyltransferase